MLQTKRNKLKPLYPKLNRNEVLTLPENTSFVVLGFRLKGSGTAKIKEILFGNAVLTDGIEDYLLRSDVLVLTNQYPQPDNLYRNMFVHKRVMVYKDSGYVFDVMRMNIYAGNGFREFEGINVIEGEGTTLLNILESNMVKTVCVHFLDAEMWSILKLHTFAFKKLGYIHTLWVFYFEAQKILVSRKDNIYIEYDSRI